jgi:hypothetical protein
MSEAKLAVVGGKKQERSFPEKLAALYERMAYVHKAGRNDHFKYKFVGEAQLKRKLNEALRELGLYVAKCEFAVAGEATGKACVARCTMVVRDSNAQPSAQFGWAGCEVLWEGLGGGADSSDKAPMKANAAAWKYAVLSGCMVETGDKEPEADSAPDDEAVESLLESLATCGNAAELYKLKVDVALFRDSPAFDALKEAYRLAVARVGK